LLSISKENPKK